MKKFHYPLWFVLITGVSLLVFPQISFSSFFDLAISNGNTLTAWINKEDILQTIIKVLEQGDEELYDYFSEEITDNFSKEDFVNGLQDAAVDIRGAEIISELTVINDAGDWAEAKIRILLEDSATLDFLVILHKENGDWRIFGTESL